MKKQMKNRTKAFLIILCVLVLISSVVAAAFLFNNGKGSGNVQSHGISFGEDSVTVEKYETRTLELVGTEDKEIVWKSKNEEIATVQDGVVCGWKKGNTQILACIDDIEVSCNVFVTDNQYIPVIDLGEPDSITMDIGGVYNVHPVLSYNGNAYTDVAYTFSAAGNAVTVDENGAVTAVEVGEAIVMVQGIWRGNAVDASLAVKVIDASTSIEVSGKVFDIYLNGRGEEFPATADIGITIFDEDTLIEQENASVQYTELIMKGDVAGAATVKNGVVYAEKLGTIHFISEYTSQAGEVVRSTLFTVNVHESPSDIYMKPIAGEEYESFITPMTPVNSVEWDEGMGAFHLTNVNDKENDGRAFLFSREYIENIIRYTGAKSIVFEVKGDGIRNGSPAPDQVIFQGFYPDWYDAGDYERIDGTDEWYEVEIFFDDIPLDKDGKRKSIMLLSTIEGMYIRNIRPMTEGSFLTMDVELTTVGGYWGQDIEIGAYPYSYKGGINDYTNRVAIKAGVKTTVKYRLNDFLENGKVPGFGLVVFGGPEWNTELADGTMDRHTLKITNLRVSGEQNYSLDLSTATWTSGKNDTGFTDANGNGVPRLENGALIIKDGFRYDGYKITLNAAKPEEGPQICFDMQITTLGNSSENIEVRFYPENFAGNVHENYTDLVSIKAGEQVTICLGLEDYLVDGEFSGIGLGIFGGPEWNTELSEGVYDRHNVVISNMRVEDEEVRTIEMHNATVTTGFGGSNAGGIATVADGKIYITDGYRYDGHIISLNEVDTCLKLDMLLTTLGNSTDKIGIRFYPYGFDGNVYEEYTDLVYVTAGTSETIYLDATKYLVEGELPGIGFAVFGGPEWNTTLEDGTYDRHAVNVSNVRLEGSVDQAINMTNATVATGFAGSNSGGIAVVVDGVVTVTGGFRYDGHMITFAPETEPEVTEPEPTDPPATEPPVEEPDTTEPPAEEPSTYISMDVLLTTMGGSTDAINVRFYPHNFAGNVHTEYTDEVAVTAGTKTTVKLELDKYLADGEFSGIGFAVFGGPAWDTQLSPGVYDRHAVTISNMRMEGAKEHTVDLNDATVVSGFGNSNSGGTASVVDGAVSVTGGFCYDGHMITFATKTEPDVTEPEETEPEETDPVTYICIDMRIDTVGGNWTDDIEVGFFSYDFEGDINNWKEKTTVTAGTQTTVRLKLDDYLVNGELPGIGVVIYGGPEWNTQLSSGVYDRHTLTVSGIRLEGAQSKSFDLSASVVVSGANGTGYTNANGSGAASMVDGSIVISNGFRYDGHKITLVEDTSTYISMDILLTTLSDSNAPVDIRFYPHGFAGNVHTEYTDKVAVTAGVKTTVRVKADKYLMDGNLPGIGIAIFGGPEWNTQISPGVYDRHTVTISGVRLEGGTEQPIDLSCATVATGFGGSNSGGTASIVDGTVVMANGFCYDGHMITFNSTQQLQRKSHFFKLCAWLLPENDWENAINEAAE